MSTDTPNEGEHKDVVATSCNTSSTFNFTVGAIAIVAALVIGYFVYARLVMP